RRAARLLYDESLYALPERIDPGQDDDADYDPGVGALALEGNLVTLRWRPAGASAVQAWASPPGAVEVALQPEAGPNRFARGVPPRAEQWAMSPALPSKGDQRLPVWRPGGHAAQVVAAVLRAVGA